MVEVLEFCGKCGHKEIEHGSFCYACTKENCFHEFVPVVLKSDYDAVKAERDKLKKELEALLK